MATPYPKSSTLHPKVQSKTHISLETESHLVAVLDTDVAREGDQWRELTGWLAY